MKTLKFIKMHGLGNDFVIIDRRKKNLKINESIIKKLSDRKTGAGCDQIITIDKSSTNLVDAKIKIFNPNGDQAEACGNGTRCVAKILFKNLKKRKIVLKSAAGKLIAQKNKNGTISVNMGKMKEKWTDIPISKKIDTRNIPIYVEGFTNGFAVNIGNPHIVFYGTNLNKINLLKIGPKIEKNNLFPKKTNVEFVKIINPKKIKMRVWERSAGETLACGSGACAAVYVGFKKYNLKNECKVILKKGSILINILDNNEVIMTGPAEISYYGEVDI